MPADLVRGDEELGLPERLHQHRRVLQDLLDLLHRRPALLDVDQRLGDVQRLVELLAGEPGLVPRHARAVAERQHHGAERPMGPGGDAERRLVPDLPVLGRRHDVDVELDAGRGQLALEDLADLLLPRPVGVAAVDADLEPVGVAGFGQQLLGLLDVRLQRRQGEVLGMDRRDVVMLAGGAAALVDQLRIGGGIAAELDRAAHALIVERLLRHLHAHGAGLRRLRLVDHRVRDRRRHGVGGDVELVDRVDLARGERCQLRRRGRAMVEVVDLVEIDRPEHVGIVDVLAPVGLPGLLQNALLPDRELGQGVRAGADRSLRQIACRSSRSRDAAMAVG